MNTAHQIEELRERGTFEIDEHYDGHGLNESISPSDHETGKGRYMRAPGRIGKALSS